MNYDFNVAFLYDFTPHWALVVGGSYEFYEEENTFRVVDIDVVTPANNQTITNRDTWDEGSTRLRAGVQMRYDRIIFGFDGTTTDGRDSIDFDEVIVAARFQFD
ncbi:MAG: hypothetical protein OEV00_15120 [Acidobacteriota bacterium]|nr:hypothetical protein [Acidobacteriota bacterium]MDH3786642.1 hypothetical protein [Acidobacteriota bacterium]